MDILISFINWVIVFILLKTFIKKFVIKCTSSYYLMSINYLLLFNFIKDTIIFFITSAIFFNGLNTNTIFPKTIVNLINWILIFILSKSIFELAFCFIVKKYTNFFLPFIQIIQNTIKNFTVKKSLFRSLVSIPWIIFTFILYNYT
jgi:hypothetical protein